jgi:hypothetical protein
MSGSLLKTFAAFFAVVVSGFRAPVAADGVVASHRLFANKRIAAALLSSSSALALVGCGGGSHAAYKPDPYAGYDCKRLAAEMEHRVGEANLLFTNYEDEDSAGKIGGGVLAGGAGAAMASSLILTPLGWVLAGGLMLAGASKIVDGVAHDDLLSDAEKRKLRSLEGEFIKLKKEAIRKECDYDAIPKWDVSPHAAYRRQQPSADGNE